MKVQSKKDFPYVVETNNDGQKVEKVIDFIIPHSQIDSQWKYAVCVNKNDWDIEDNLDETQKSYPIISFEEWQSLPDFPKPEYEPKYVAFKEQPWIFSIKLTEDMMHPYGMSLEEFEIECGKKFNSKPIIGYKLIKPEYKEAAKIIALSHVGEKIKYYKGNIETIGVKNGAPCKKALEEAGVLSLWFEPIYDTSITLKSGVKLSEDDIAEVKEILNNK